MIPNNWNQISVNQFIELRELGVVPFSSIIEKNIETLLTVSDLEVEEVEDMSTAELNKHVKSLAWLNREPHKKYTKKIGDYTAIPFKKITWGMFIDLEHYYSENYIKELPTICGIFYRQTTQDEWGKIIYEPYEYNPIERGDKFKQLPITSVYGLATSYLEFRDSLINDKYANLFEKPIDEEEVELTGQDLKEYEEAKEAEERFNKWSYESITLQLANNDITKMDEILNMGLIYVLNMLSMQVDLK